MKSFCFFSVSLSSLLEWLFTVNGWQNQEEGKLYDGRLAGTCRSHSQGGWLPARILGHRTPQSCCLDILAKLGKNKRHRQMNIVSKNRSILEISQNVRKWKWTPFFSKSCCFSLNLMFSNDSYNKLMINTHILIYKHMCM